MTTGRILLVTTTQGARYGVPVEHTNETLARQPTVSFLCYARVNKTEANHRRVKLHLGETHNRQLSVRSSGCAVYSTALHPSNDHMRNRTRRSCALAQGQQPLLKTNERTLARRVLADQLDSDETYSAVQCQNLLNVGLVPKM